MNKIWLILIAGLLLQSCGGGNQDEKSKLDTISWISGYWEMTTPDGSTVTESWIRTSDSTYTGVGKFIDSTGKVLTTEEIVLALRGDKLWYIPAINNQNGGQPVNFKEVQFADTMVVFENKEHDFPQRIIYRKTPDGNLLAYIEGEINGEMQKIEYPYTKK